MKEKYESVPQNISIVLNMCIKYVHSLNCEFFKCCSEATLCSKGLNVDSDMSLHSYVNIVAYITSFWSQLSSIKILAFIASF